MGIMSSEKNIDKIMYENGISLFGVMDYSAILPEMLLDCRAKIRLPQNAKRVIVCAFPYYINIDSVERNVCRYAVFRDYHQVIGDILQKAADKLHDKYGFRFECFCDNSPLPEIFCAVKAGIGFRGKNKLLITKKYGSYVLLGCIVTDCEFLVDVACEEHCLACGKCITSCPALALSDNDFAASQCLSYITQKKGALTIEEENAIKSGGLVWGCDRCQEVCPHNIGIEETYISDFLLSIEPILSGDNLEYLMKSRPYGYRGKKLLERNLRLIIDRLI